MRIIVLADTHIPKRAKKLPAYLLAELRHVDLIIHAGDWQTLDVYHELCQYANVVGVAGNVDGKDIQELFGEKEVLQLYKYRIGITHGHGKGMTTEKRAIAAFQEEVVDCIIFGHSHIPVLKYENGILLFNPGSATDRRKQPFYSFGIISIEEELRAQHVFYQDRS